MRHATSIVTFTVIGMLLRAVPLRAHAVVGARRVDAECGCGTGTRRRGVRCARALVHVALAARACKTARARTTLRFRARASVQTATRADCCMSKGDFYWQLTNLQKNCVLERLICICLASITVISRVSSSQSCYSLRNTHACKYIRRPRIPPGSDTCRSRECWSTPRPRGIRDFHLRIRPPTTENQ